MCEVDVFIKLNDNEGICDLSTAFYVKGKNGKIYIDETEPGSNFPVYKQHSFENGYWIRRVTLKNCANQGEENNIDFSNPNLTTFYIKVCKHNQYCPNRYAIYEPDFRGIKTEKMYVHKATCTGKLLIEIGKLNFSYCANCCNP